MQEIIKTFLKSYTILIKFYNTSSKVMLYYCILIKIEIKKEKYYETKK